eukprot:UN12220
MHPFSRMIMEGKDDKLLVMIRRNKAPNPVVYRARFKDNDIKNGFDNNPIEIFWLKIANSVVARHRESGKEDDRVEVSYLESTMAYGLKYQQIENRQEYKIVFNALPKWPCVLKVCRKDSKPKLFGSVDGKQCHLKDIHVTMKKKKNWFGIPSVDYITLKGFRCDDDAYIEHKITS